MEIQQSWESTEIQQRPQLCATQVHLPKPQVKVTYSFIERVRARLAALPPTPSSTGTPLETFIPPETTPGHPTNVAPNVTPTASTAANSSNVETTILCVPTVFSFHKIHVSPTMPIAEQILLVWERKISERLRTVLVHEITSGTCVQDFMMAGRKADRLRPTVVITCGDRKTQRRVQKAFKQMNWLQDLLKVNGILFVAATEPVPMTSALWKRQAVSTSTTPIGAIVGGVVGGVAVVILLATSVWVYLRRSRVKESRERHNEPQGAIDLTPGYPGAAMSPYEWGGQKAQHHPSSQGVVQPSSGASVPEMAAYSPLRYELPATSPYLWSRSEIAGSTVGYAAPSTTYQGTEFSAIERKPYESDLADQTSDHRRVIVQTPSASRNMGDQQAQSDYHSLTNQNDDAWRPVSSDMFGNTIRALNNTEASYDQLQRIASQPPEHGDDVEVITRTSLPSNAVGRHNVRDNRPLCWSQDNSSRITMCGQKLLVTTTDNVQGQRCTIGGLVRVNQAIYGLTVAHPLSLVQKTRSLDPHGNGHTAEPDQSDNNSSDELSDDPFWFGEDDSEEQILHNGADPLHGPAQDQGKDKNGTKSHSGGFNDILQQRYHQVSIIAHSPLNNASKTIPEAALTLQNDWALISLTPSSTLLPNIISRNNSVTASITELAPGTIQGNVSIMFGDKVYPGILRSSTSTFQIEGMVYNVKMIVLNEVLALGCSGSWVITQDNKLCGHIIAARQDIPWAYMIPAQSTFEDVGRVLCTGQVALPGTADFDEVTRHLHSEVVELE